MADEAIDGFLLDTNRTGGILDQPLDEGRLERPVDRLALVDTAEKRIDVRTAPVQPALDECSGAPRGRSPAGQGGRTRQIPDNAYPAASSRRSWP